MKIAVLLLLSAAIHPVTSQKALDRVRTIVQALGTLKTDIKDSVTRTRNILNEKKCFCLKESDRIHNMQVRSKARADFLKADKDQIDHKEYTAAVVANITATGAQLASMYGASAVSSTHANVTAQSIGLCVEVRAINDDTRTKLDEVCAAYPGSSDAATLLSKKTTHLPKVEVEAIIEHQMHILVSHKKLLDSKTLRLAQAVRQQIHSSLGEAIDPLMDPVCANVRNVQTALRNVKEAICAAPLGYGHRKASEYDDVVAHFSTATGNAGDGSQAGDREKELRKIMKEEYVAEESELRNELGSFESLASELKTGCDADIDFLVNELDKASYEAAAIDVLLHAFNSDETNVVYFNAKHKYTDMVYRPSFLQVAADPVSKEAGTTPELVDDSASSMTKEQIFADLKKFVNDEIAAIKADAETDYAEREKCRQQAVTDGDTVLTAARDADSANTQLRMYESTQQKQFYALKENMEELQALEDELAALTTQRGEEKTNYLASLTWLKQGIEIVGNATEIMNTIFLDGKQEAFMGGKNRNPMDQKEGSKLDTRTENGNSGDSSDESTTYGERSLARSSSVKVTPKYIASMLESLKTHMQSTLDVVEYTEQKEIKYFNKQKTINQEARDAKQTQITAEKNRMDDTSGQETTAFDSIKTSVSEANDVLLDGESVKLEGASWTNNLNKYGYFGRAEHCTAYMREFENRELNRWHSIKELEKVKGEFPKFQELLSGI